jgi:hypothetical protein
MMTNQKEENDKFKMKNDKSKMKYYKSLSMIVLIGK